LAGQADGWHLGHRPSLDAVRGVAVLLVLAGHFHLVDEVAATVGVSLFFVLSGYLITALLLGEWGERGRIDYRRFYLRRARRLLPALAVILGVLGVAAAAHGELDRWLPGAALAALYAGNWAFLLGMLPQNLAHTWSLAIEEQFYLVWPILLASLARPGFVALRVCVVALIVGSVVLTLPHIGTMGMGYYGSPQRAKELLAGALLAIVCVRAGRDLAIPTPVAIFAVGFMAWCAGAMDALGPLVYVMPATVIVAWAAAHPHAFAWKPLTSTGRISYGLYLYHYPLIGIAAPALALIGVAYALACASWLLVERRFLTAAIPTRIRAESSSGPIVTWDPAAVPSLARLARRSANDQGRLVVAE
jgi:peptidoglycan/LPS O-acetylase OafA/YrhL